jgi:hypothetical protein
MLWKEVDDAIRRLVREVEYGCDYNVFCGYKTPTVSFRFELFP